MFLDNIQAETDKHIEVIHFRYKGEVEQTVAAEVVIELINKQKPSEECELANLTIFINIIRKI